jgi:hypothetical protein
MLKLNGSSISFSFIESNYKTIILNLSYMSPKLAILPLVKNKN